MFTIIILINHTTPFVMNIPIRVYLSLYPSLSLSPSLFLSLSAGSLLFKYQFGSLQKAFSITDKFQFSLRMKRMRMSHLDIDDCGVPQGKTQTLTVVNLRRADADNNHHRAGPCAMVHNCFIGSDIPYFKFWRAEGVPNSGVREI